MQTLGAPRLSVSEETATQGEGPLSYGPSYQITINHQFFNASFSAGVRRQLQIEFFDWRISSLDYWPAWPLCGMFLAYC